MAPRKLPSSEELTPPVISLDDDNGMAGISCETSFTFSNPDLLELRDASVPFSYNAYFNDTIVEDDIDRETALKAMDQVLLKIFAVGSGLMNPLEEVGNVECDSRLENSLGYVAQALNFVVDDDDDDDDDVNVINERHNRSPMRPTQRNEPSLRNGDLSDSTNDGWNNILGLKTQTPGGQVNNDRECPVDIDIDSPGLSCKPISGFITVQVSRVATVSSNEIKTQILGEMRRAISESELTTTDIPITTFVIPEDLDGNTFLGRYDTEVAALTSIVEGANDFTAFGITSMVLFVTAGFVGLIVLLMTCLRFTRAYKKKRLLSPKVHHYPITGDSSNSSSSINTNKKDRSTDNTINILEEVLSKNTINVLEESLSYNAENELSGVACCTMASSQFITDAENERSGSTCCTIVSSQFCNEKTPNQKEDQNTAAVEMVSKGNVGDLGPVNLFVDGKSVTINSSTTEYLKSKKIINKNRGNDRTADFTSVNLVDDDDDEESVANNSVKSVKSMGYMGKSLGTWMESIRKTEDDGSVHCGIDCCPRK